MLRRQRRLIEGRRVASRGFSVVGASFVATLLTLAQTRLSPISPIEIRFRRAVAFSNAGNLKLPERRTSRTSAL